MIRRYRYKNKKTVTRASGNVKVKWNKVFPQRSTEPLCVMYLTVYTRIAELEKQGPEDGAEILCSVLEILLEANIGNNHADVFYKFVVKYRKSVRSGSDRTEKSVTIRCHIVAESNELSRLTAEVSRYRSNMESPHYELVVARHNVAIETLFYMIIVVSLTSSYPRQ